MLRSKSTFVAMAGRTFKDARSAGSHEADDVIVRLGAWSSSRRVIHTRCTVTKAQVGVANAREIILLSCTGVPISFSRIP